MACARCRRPLTREPIVIDGRGYGPRCADLVVVPDLLDEAKPKRVRSGRRRKQDERQLVLEVRP